MLEVRVNTVHMDSLELGHALTVSCLCRPDDPRWAGVVRLSVPLSRSKRPEVASCRARRLLRSEHATGSRTLAQYGGAAEAAAADGLGPEPHRQSQGLVRRLM